MSRFTLLGVGAGAQNRTEAIGLQVRCSTFELRRQNWRKMMESNHQPSLAGTAFKTACAPCAPSSVVGAAGIEPATSCSQSKRATAALRPDDWLLVLRALPAAAMELPRRIGQGEAPGADLRQSFDFTNIEACRT